VLDVGCSRDGGSHDDINRDDIRGGNHGGNHDVHDVHDDNHDVHDDHDARDVSNDVPCLFLIVLNIP